MGSPKKRLQYLYDSRGNRRALVDQDGGRFTYTYDAVNRITQVINPQGDRTSYSYDPAGRRTLKRMANGTRASFSYDPAGNLTGLYNLKSNGNVISSFDYQYDRVGNRTAVLEADGSRVTWSYDATYQLTGEHRTGTTPYEDTYSYDATGNRLTKVHDGARTTYSYDPANQLEWSEDASGRTTYTFDADGNQQVTVEPNGDRTTNTWDYENRMTRVELPSGVRNTMAYEPGGLRVKLQESTDTKKFVWDEQNYLAETDENDDTQAVYTNEPRLYGALICQQRATQSHWYHFDVIGSTRELTDSSAVVTNTRLYDAWGGQLTASGFTITPFTFAGELEYYNDSNGQYYVRARHLTPSGRWTSSDPLSNNRTIQKYDYVGNRPMYFVDPDGKDVVIIVGGGVIVIGGVWVYKYNFPGTVTPLSDHESHYIFRLLQVLQYCAIYPGILPGTQHGITPFTRCKASIIGKFVPGGSPDGSDGTSLTYDPGWAWPTRIALSADFFERDACSQYFTLVKECVLRKHVRNFDDTGMSDNVADNLFEEFECCLRCCGHTNRARWPEGDDSCCGDHRPRNIRLCRPVTVQEVEATLRELGQKE